MKKKFCWVCHELEKVPWALIELSFNGRMVLTQELFNEFNYCPKCGRKI